MKKVAEMKIQIQNLFFFGRVESIPGDLDQIGLILTDQRSLRAEYRVTHHGLFCILEK